MKNKKNSWKLSFYNVKKFVFLFVEFYLMMKKNLATKCIQIENLPTIGRFGITIIDYYEYGRARLYANKAFFFSDY